MLGDERLREWEYLEDVLDELGLIESELREAYPGIDLDHVGLDGRRVVDRRSLDHPMDR
jgi:hypothetical protein